MNNQENSMVIANQNKNIFEVDGYDLVVDLTSAQTQFCSMKAESDEEKAALFNAMNDPDKRLGDCINMTIQAKDLYIEVVNCTDEQTGEVTAAPRIVIIDESGKSYQCVSVGVFSALKKIIQVFGAPTWEKPLPITIKQITKGKKSMLTLNVAM